MKINVQSEIGALEAVLLHTPGAEVENMTPRMAQRALIATYSTFQLPFASTSN